MSKILKVGDAVFTNHGEAKVIKIEIVEPGQKEDGIDVSKIYWSLKDYVIVDLDNGHWSYGYNIQPINDDENEDILNTEDPVIH